MTDMTSTDQAPDISPGYPSKGRLVGPAWQAMWDRMRKAGAEFTDGRVLAEETAKGRESAFHAQGNEMSPETCAHLLRRAADRGLLERDYRISTGNRGARNRAWYRIKQGA